MGDILYDEQIVMTPTKKSRDHNIILIERTKPSEMDQKNIMHIAGGDHTGIIISKEPGPGVHESVPPDVFLGFRVMLKSLSNNKKAEENWLLKFWFKTNVAPSSHVLITEAFFSELLPGGEYPKDYVTFIKKTMKLMQQQQYRNVRKLEVEMKKLDESLNVADFVDEGFVNSKLSTSQEKLLDIVEAVYPNSLSIAAIAKSSDHSEEQIFKELSDLVTKGYIKCMPNGNYIRITGNDDVKMVKQMPMLPFAKQPVIAIITALYSEKIAVDAMIENKETFVRYKTEGESNVFTLGTIGAHRVVSTKLPAVGHTRGPMIAAGSITTRLLGTFQRVEYVFLVGVGGGVPHYTDYNKHVRLGDVVVSTPPDPHRPYIYMYCEKQKSLSDSVEDISSCDQLNIKTWCPPSLELQRIAQELWKQGLINPKSRSWEYHIEHGLRQLYGGESSFCRPSPDTDKLYMSLGGQDLIEVGHPQPAEGSFDPRTPEMPVLHFGAVGSGRILMKDDTTRLEFADRHGILAFDTEFDAVVESIFGNRKDDYVFIRGIADYKDGTKKKEWQPYAALAAAAVMKSIICNLHPCN